MADSQPLIAVRIKDGIFVGNVTAAHDEDFLYVNKVTHIVNCSGAEVSDMFADSGIEYLTFPWKDTPGVVNTTVMFDSNDRNVEQVVRFMDRAIDNGDCVLVHSVYGMSRSPALVAAYFMVKYGWKVDNALSFLAMAHQEMNIKPHFLRQLRMFAKRHDVDTDVFSLEVDDNNFALDNDQWMLRNTLLNGLTSDVQAKNELFNDCSARVDLPDLFYKNPTKRRRRLCFVDTRQGTAVGSTASTPVTNVKTWSGQHHVDPNGEHFPGSAGPRAVRSSKPKSPIAARHGTPNSRLLESRPEVNAKGRQILGLRPSAVVEAKPQPPVPQQHILRPGSGYSSLDNNSPRPTVSSGGSQQQQGPSRINSFSDQPSMQPVIVQRGGQSTLVDTQRGRPLETSAQRNTNMNNSLDNIRGGGGAPANVIRSPFALTSSSVPRNGSPLPQQRLQNQRAGAPQPTTLNTYNLQDANRSTGPVEATGGLRGTARPPPVHEIRSNATGGSNAALPRASSPMAQPNVSNNNTTGQRRTSSPMGTPRPTPQPQPSVSMASQVMSSRASSPRGSIPTYSQQTMVQRRPSSPLSRGPSSMPLPNTSSGGSGVQRTPMSTYSSASTLQQQRALSPMSRSSLPSSGGLLPRTSSPVQRPSSVVQQQQQQRTISPRPMQQISRTSSPMRGSLAEQYLGGGGGSQLPRTSTTSAIPTSAANVPALYRLQRRMCCVAVSRCKWQPGACSFGVTCSLKRWHTTRPTGEAACENKLDIQELRARCT
ncbi:dual specificity protein phosphatase, putative [Bodo saltans]|uniref:Dual specificity protein phosphatase, putative n=1 Tax=Bodo saltans TaxID=75058 RepID=A0A0S4JFG5_BODSA|nr:dual specificity protein phosphatase, putative [Bodo saltans]|eukprot:CUG89202.1 dual specificity protein phosphatase, putative [Bodo saltans]